MKTFAKALVLSAAVAATAVVPLATAQADDWHHHHHDNNGNALAAGALGLAAGAIIGGAIASDPGPRYYADPPAGYYAPPPRVVYRTYEPAPVYARGLRPWTRSWYRYCGERYRSFDPRSGTFIGFDGRSHFCVAD